MNRDMNQFKCDWISSARFYFFK